MRRSTILSSLQPPGRGRPRVRWTATFTCPRPRNRAVDDFHLRPDRVTRTVQRLIGPRARLTLDGAFVRLVRTSPSRPDLARWQEELAIVLDSLHLETRVEGRYVLPRPVRVELLEEDVPPGEVA
ncbi:hypothetical protein ACWGIR_23275 [Streptomyces albidoflavus]